MKLEVYGDSIETRVTVDPVFLLWEWRVWTHGGYVEAAKGLLHALNVATGISKDEEP